MSPKAKRTYTLQSKKRKPDTIVCAAPTRQKVSSHVESSLPYSLNKMGMSSTRNCGVSEIRIVIYDKQGENEKRDCCTQIFSIDGR
jgi:hypothetical protein